MKKQLALIALLFSHFAASAQERTTAQTRRVTVNESSIVKDSAGIVYPYVIWQKLLQTGDFSLRTTKTNQDDPEFLLVKLSEQEKAARISRMPRPADSKFFTTGATIKPFKIKDINGNKIEAKDWIGNTVVLNFWFIGCPPCRAEIPDLNKLALKYKDNPNVLFIAAALDEGWQVKDFTKQSPLAYHLVGDGRYYAGLFNITLYPTNVVIDKQGKVMLHYSGGYQNGPYWIDKMIQESEKAL